MSASLRSSAAERFRLLPVGLIILSSFAWTSQAATQSVTLAWDPATNAAGYRLYSGTTSHVYTQQIDVGNVTSTMVSNLIAGQTYFFAVTGYNAAGVESAPSNEVSYVGGAPTPTPIPTPTPTPTPTIQVTVHTNPVGLAFSVDGTSYSSTQTFSWIVGSSHTIATTSPQDGGGAGVRYVWSSWTGGGAISHTVAPTINETYTATFRRQYYLTMAHGTGGNVSPTSGWKNGGSTLSITAKPATGYSFSSWSGTGTGSFSGTSNPASVTMGGPITESATFTHN